MRVRLRRAERTEKLVAFGHVVGFSAPSSAGLSGRGSLSSRADTSVPAFRLNYQEQK